MVEWHNPLNIAIGLTPNKNAAPVKQACACQRIHYQQAINCGFPMARRWRSTVKTADQTMDDFNPRVILIGSFAEQGQPISGCSTLRLKNC